jgi:hypothetical protein
VTPVSIDPGNNGIGKIDWNVTERHHINGLYFRSQATSFNEGNVKPYWGDTGNGTVYEYVGSWTWTPSSFWVNDFRFGTAVTTGQTVLSDVARPLATAFPVGYGINTGVTNPDHGGFPCIDLDNAGFSNLGACGTPGTRGPQGQLSFRDSISYLHGNHSFRFGGEVVNTKFFNGSVTRTQGVIFFNTLQNFLTGTIAPSGSAINGGDTTNDLRQRWYAAFFGDTWRVTPRLTLTPGIRYEYMAPPTSSDLRMGTFNAAIPGGIARIGTTPGFGQQKLYNAQKANFFPRVGAAWDIMGNGKTVLRGGVGLFGSFPSITSFVQPVPIGSNLCRGTATNAQCVTGSPDLVVDHTGDPVQQSAVFTVPYTPGQLNWSQAGPIFPITAGGVAPCTAVTPCQTGAPDPNFRYPKSLQWNLDIQRAITNNLALTVAYVANHGYDETLATNWNSVPVGVGWNTPWTAADLTAQTGSPASRYASTGANGALNVGKTSQQLCLGQGFAGDLGKCRPNTGAITRARPYNLDFPYLSYIVGPSAGGWSNYNALQVTVDGRNYHGVSFLVAYTYAHALDTWSRSSQNASLQVDPSNYGLQYGNGDRDFRHRARFSPRWQIPGIRTPGQMLEGWGLSGVVSIQGGSAWGADHRTGFDFAGNGQIGNSNASPNNGVVQTWNYSGPRSAFNSNARSGNTMPCYGVLNGCTPFASAPAQIVTDCQTAAQSHYSGNAQLQALALQSMNNFACYIRDGGVLTPPAYGTVGNAGRNPFRGPSFYNVDLTTSKDWNIGERYSAQLRVEVFNLFNTPGFANPGVNPNGGFGGLFGYTNSQSGMGFNFSQRRMQFGLKIGF